MCVQNSSHVDDEIHVSSLDVSTRWMDETIVTSKKCSPKNDSRTSNEDQCANGTFRRCNRNQVSTVRETTGFLTNSRRIKIVLGSYLHAKGV